jgi:hypothetical protein
MITDAPLHGEANPAPGVPYDPAQSQRGGGLLIVDFGIKGNSALYRTFGWSGQEETYVWTIGGSSGLRLPPAAGRTPLRLVIDLSICVFAPLVTSAIVRVFANGHRIGSARVIGRTRLSFAVPEGLIPQGEPIDLRFEHPCFVRPDFVGRIGETRPLGLCIYSLALYPPWFGRAAEVLLPLPDHSYVAEATSPPPEAPNGATEDAMYRFGASGDSLSLLGKNWSLDAEGHTYSSGRVSTLQVAAPSPCAQYLVRISLCALYILGRLPIQRISILVNGAVIGHYLLGSDTILSIPLPREICDESRTLEFSFFSPDGFPIKGFADQSQPFFASFVLDFIAIDHMPDCLPANFNLRGDDVENAIPIAVSDRFIDDPADSVQSCIETAVGAPAREFLARFESIGDNCFFGGAQRRAGCEVLGLLRFANVPVRSLLTALADDFAALQDRSGLTMRLWDYTPEEYFLHLDRYGIRWHTGVFRPAANSSPLPDLVKIFDLHFARLNYLRRKFYETLRSGRKIFILARADLRETPKPLAGKDEFPYLRVAREPLRLAEVLPLLVELNRYARSTILYITEATAGRRSGTVELIAPGIMRGYVSSLKVPPELGDDQYAAWLSVTANAWLLNNDPNSSFRNKSVS